MGGHWALWLASRQQSSVPRVDAAVAYYGVRGCDFKASVAQVQLHLAGDDPLVSAASVRATRRKLGAASRPLEVHQYPGARHWFAESDRPEYDAAAAALAWQRTESFLVRRLALGLPEA